MAYTLVYTYVYAPYKNGKQLRESRIVHDGVLFIQLYDKKNFNANVFNNHIVWWSLVMKNICFFFLKLFNHFGDTWVWPLPFTNVIIICFTGFIYSQFLFCSLSHSWQVISIRMDYKWPTRSRHSMMEERIYVLSCGRYIMPGVLGGYRKKNENFLEKLMKFERWKIFIIINGCFLLRWAQTEFMVWITFNFLWLQSTNGCTKL